MFLVICYDITDSRRRVKVSKELLSYGERVQESVYEVYVTEAQWKRLQTRLQVLIAEPDRIRCYTLCVNCRNRIHTSAGHPTAQPPPRCVVI